MKLLSVAYGANELPESLTVAMTTAEAAWLERVISTMPDNIAGATDKRVDGVNAKSGIGDVLYPFFNRHWGAGVDGYLNGDFQ